jgi:hypothetical protein
MRLVCLVVHFVHRQACLLGGQTTNRIFNYAADIPQSQNEPGDSCNQLMLWQ